MRRILIEIYPKAKIFLIVMIAPLESSVLVLTQETFLLKTLQTVKLDFSALARVLERRVINFLSTFAIKKDSYDLSLAPMGRSKMK